MSMRNGLVTILLVMGLSACAGPTLSSRNVTPNFASAETGSAPTAVMAISTSVAIKGIEISVPQALRTSEANVMVPVADIVWRGDPMGDRHTQVAAIFQAAATTATAGMTDGRGVILSLEVTRFHALTEKARYLTGGNYAMHFLMTLRDAQTGIVIDGPREVIADVRASGGVRAIAEDNAGRTEKVVITERLVQVMRDELTHLVLQPTT